MRNTRLVPHWLLPATVFVSGIPTLSWAGRPLAVDDAAPVAPGSFELEAGVLYENDSGVRHYEFPVGLACGVVPTLEIGLGFGSQIEQREERQETWNTVSGLGDLTVGAKWNPLAADAWWADHALSFAVKFPTANHHKNFGSGEADFDLTYIASKEVFDDFSLHLNAGYTWTGNPAGESLDDIVHCGVAGGFQISEEVELVAELYADVPLQHADESPLIFNTGACWSALDCLVLDAAIGVGLRGDAPDWMATVGLTWTFSPFHSR